MGGSRCSPRKSPGRLPSSFVLEKSASLQGEQLLRKQSPLFPLPPLETATGAIPWVGEVTLRKRWFSWSGLESLNLAPATFRDNSQWPRTYGASKRTLSK